VRGGRQSPPGTKLAAKVAKAMVRAVIAAAEGRDEYDLRQAGPAENLSERTKQRFGQYLCHASAVRTCTRTRPLCFWI